VAGKKVCATGTISEYRGSPEIVAKSQEQVTVTKSLNSAWSSGG
jgi:hypothetical protein